MLQGELLPPGPRRPAACPGPGPAPHPPPHTLALPRRSQTLDAAALKKFRKSVKDDYYFQMYYDDLPIWGFIGKIEKILKPGQPELRYYLFTHGAAAASLPAYHSLPACRPAGLPAQP